MKIMVIDGKQHIEPRVYGIRQLTNHEGLPTNAVYGFLATLFKLQDEEQPDRTIVCFDVKEKTFRHLKFDTYKATRKGMPDELAAQLPITKQVLDALGVTRCELAATRPMTCSAPSAAARTSTATPAWSSPVTGTACSWSAAARPLCWSPPAWARHLSDLRHRRFPRKIRLRPDSPD